ncbi:glycosyltransferase [Methylobacterium sp. CM6257]
MRLAVFADMVLWRDGAKLFTNESYALFLASFSSAVERVVLIGREAPQPGRAPYALDSDLFELCPLPYYQDLYRLWRSNPRIYQRIRRAITGQVRDWDAILICGPHPIGQMIARICIAHGVPVVLVVRQNLVKWQVSAHSGLKRLAAVAAAAALELDFRRLARRRTVLAVGAEMADAYRHCCERVYDHHVCLISRAEFEASSRMAVGNDPTRLICIGRLSPEKGHAYLLAALVELRRRGMICHVDVVGTGALDAEVRALARRLNLVGQVSFHGYIAYGPPLFALYSRAGTMVLPSLTEGFPQVVDEALSFGLPIVATAVGGVPAFLSNGDTALLVPPRDPSALADAIERIVREPVLREGLARRGRALMAANTLEVNRDRVLDGIRHAITMSRAVGDRAGRPGFGCSAPTRSALEACPLSPAPTQPRVSLVVPLRNEIAALDGLVADILAQDYAAIDEIWFADGGSTDGTREALQRLSERDPRFAVLDNHSQSTAAGLNLALSRATGSVVMRLDAHASYSADLVRVCVAALLRTGAAGVGTVARPAPAQTLVGRAIVAAHWSPFGIGVAKFRRDGAEGWATSVWNGCYWRFVVDQVGPIREDLPRAEDNDYNQRVRALGYGLYVTSEACALYQTRQTLRALGRQYLGNGFGVARTLFENPGAVAPHHLAPLVLVSVLLATAATGVVWPLAHDAAAVSIALYLSILLTATLLSARTERGLHLLALPITLATLHVSYGLGSLLGIGRRVASWLRPAMRGGN